MLPVSSRLTYAADWLRKQLDDQNWIRSTSAAAFIGFVGATYLVPGHAIPVAMIAVTILVACLGGTLVENFRRYFKLWIVLALFCAWTILGAAAGGPGYRASDFSNLLLLGAFFLFMAQVSRVLTTRQILGIIAVAGGISALGSLVLHIVSEPNVFDRLSPLGRGRNPIPGAGGLAIAVIAYGALLLKGAAKLRYLPLQAALMIVLLVAVVWTQSRAPILALGLALPLGFWISRRGGSGAVLAACGGIWLLITGLGLVEPVVKAVICDNELDWCRPAFRAEIWAWVREQIALHPLLGTGPNFRFPREWMSHPHNGLLGIAMYYGLPILVAFGALVVSYARAVSAQGDRTLRFFGIASIIFSFGYMGTDLSNPFAFFNMHYLFLWLPIFLILSSERETVQDEEADPVRSSDQLRQI